MDSMHRRNFIKTTSLGAATYIASQNSIRAKNSNQKQPNVILIMADDIGYECFGFNGSQQYSTPNLDRLAQTGVRFTHCYSNPLCTPSRACLMTGQSNIRNYYTFGILLPDQKTFGHMMQQAGYRTAVVGKWQLYGPDEYGNLEGKGMLPNDAGFDEYCLWQVKKRKSRYWNPLIDQNGQYLENIEDRYGPDIFGEYIENYIEKNKSNPFFLYYPMTLPHGPFLPTPHSQDRNSENIQRNYEDMVAYMDTIIGRIVQTLDRYGLRENTLLLFTGDNGTPRQIKSEFNGRIIQGGKGLTIDAGTHVPLIANWPGVIPKGKVCEDLIDFCDFLPTVSDATGASLPTDRTLDGQSFFPQLKGEANSPRTAIFTYYNPRPLANNNRAQQNPTHRFARDKRWKLYGDGRLYDIKNDVLEQLPTLNETDTDGARKARQKLQAVIDSMPTEPLRLMREQTG